MEIRNIKDFEGEPKFSDDTMFFNLQDLMYTTVVKKSSFQPWLENERGQTLYGDRKDIAIENFDQIPD